MVKSKKCSKCGAIKPRDCFYKNSRLSDGLDSWCINCQKISTNRYYKTKRGIITRIYNTQKYNSKKRGHLPPGYSKDELIEYLSRSDVFNKLYEDWVISNFKKDKTPSCDRIDNSIGYEVSNILITTWRKNMDNAIFDMRKGVLKNGTNPQTEVIATSILDNSIHFFVSQNEASRVTGIKQSNINKCLKGLRKTAGGYKWKYKNK